MHRVVWGKEGESRRVVRSKDGARTPQEAVECVHLEILRRMNENIPSVSDESQRDGKFEVRICSNCRCDCSKTPLMRRGPDGIGTLVQRLRVVVQSTCKRCASIFGGARRNAAQGDIHPKSSQKPKSTENVRRVWIPFIDRASDARQGLRRGAPRRKRVHFGVRAARRNETRTKRTSSEPSTTCSIGMTSSSRTPLLIRMVYGTIPPHR